MFEIPNHNPISTPSQVRKSKKSRKTSKRLLKKVYTCIMILLTTQTKEKKMDKENISADTLANYFDKPERIEEQDKDLYDALIDVFVDHYEEPEETKQYQCRICKNETELQKGIDTKCPNCKDKTVIWWTEV